VVTPSCDRRGGKDDKKNRFKACGMGGGEGRSVRRGIEWERRKVSSNTIGKGSGGDLKALRDLPYSSTCKRVRAELVNLLANKWGNTLDYLRKKQNLEEAEETADHGLGFTDKYRKTEHRKWRRSLFQESERTEEGRSLRTRGLLRTDVGAPLEIL